MSLNLKPCEYPNCGNYAKKGKICSTCVSRIWRENNPVRSAYLNLKAHAKERGIFFLLSMKYFTEFCKKYNYIALKGIGRDDLTIDRVIPGRGYTDGNLQALTNAANKSKDFKDRKGWGTTNEYYSKRKYKRAA